MENMAALSNSDGPVDWVTVPVTVVAPAEDKPAADPDAADTDAAAASDIPAKAESALDSSPKCGDTFLLGWLFGLIGIAK